MKVSKVVLNDKAVANFKIDDNGFKFEEASKNEVVDDILILGETCKGNITRLVNETRDEMFEKLKSGLKTTVLDILGFDKDNWGSNKGYRIDHCNSRNSFISEHIAKDVEDFIVNTTIGDLEISQEEVDELCKAVMDDWKDSFKLKIRRKAQAYLDGNIESQVMKAFESKLSEVVDVNKIANEMIQELIVNK